MDDQTINRIIGSGLAIGAIYLVYHLVLWTWRFLKSLFTKLPTAAEGAGRLTAKAGKLADQFKQGYRDER